MIIKYMSNTEIRIGVIGNVDSGKSTLVSVLSKKLLDDGRGKARKLVLKHPHEKDTGRTSDVTQTHLIKDKGYITFIDLAGHERYLKTTLKGLTGGYIDYVLLVIGANMGVSMMTKEHISIAYALQIPIIIVVTKMDLSNDHVLKKTNEDINKLVTRFKFKNIRIISDDNKDNKLNFKKILPLFYVSNKTGKNINLLRDYLINLKPKLNWNKEDKKIFSIDEKYNVTGVGIVLSGKVRSGTINKGDKLFLGPFYGKWELVTVKSIHDNFRNVVDYLEAGDSGCLAIKGINKKAVIKKNRLRKGVILVEKRNNSSRFNADVIILRSHSNNIKLNYQPVINCKTVCQSAEIVEMKKKYLKGGEKSNVEFKFLFYPEHIVKDDIFLFRDGRTKGIGRILEVK